MRKKSIETVITKEGKEIQVSRIRKSAIKSATGIVDTGLYSDANYKLRDQFEFGIDKNNTRSEAGTIISRENIDTDMLTLASARYVFERNTWNKFTDSSFTEFKELGTDIKYGAPLIDQLEWQNVNWVKARVDGKTANSEYAKMANDLGETELLKINSNHNFVIVANAYNYTDKRGKKNRDNLTFTWKFSSGENNHTVNVLDKVVGHGRRLIIENAQRAHIGRYTCEVSNDKGRTFTISKYLFVYRPGDIVSKKSKVAGEEIETGGKFWTDTDKTWNKKYTRFDDMMDYSLEDEKWYSMYWNTNGKKFERKNLRTAINKRPGFHDKKIKHIKKTMFGKGQIAKVREHGYWKYAGDPTVYWSDSIEVIEFSDSAVYFEHREQLGYEEDWTEIDTITSGHPNKYLLDGDHIRTI